MRNKEHFRVKMIGGKVRSKEHLGVMRQGGKLRNKEYLGGRGKVVR